MSGLRRGVFDLLMIGVRGGVPDGVALLLPFPTGVAIEYLAGLL